MIRTRAGVAGCILLLGGCSYHNVIFNAEQLFAEAEVLRRIGEDSLAVARYSDVVQKTGEAFRARPGSKWSDEALFLLGRSHFRLGNLRAARSALEDASDVTDNGYLWAEILVYKAAVGAARGDRRAALRDVNRALEGRLSGPVLADAHLLRGRLLLERGLTDQAWWDLDRATAAHPDVLVEAGLERFLWSVRLGDADRAQRATETLLRHREGGVRADTILALVDRARGRWGPERAAELLRLAEDSPWDRTAKGTIRLQRARLLDAAGDTAAATAEALEVAGGLGVSAAEARLLLSDWQLARAPDLATVYGVRSTLLPGGADPRVSARLAALERLEVFADLGLDDPLGWFAAAEVARDRLGARYVARGLFIAYADGAADDPWVAKALLAALEVSPNEGDRAWLRGRLEAHPDSPYVLAAFGGPAAGFEDLEEELDLRLRELDRR